VRAKVPKGDGFRFEVEVWAENERGEKKSVGTVEVDVGVSDSAPSQPERQPEIAR
jgi:hypothetical protein